MVVSSSVSSSPSMFSPTGFLSSIVPFYSSDFPPLDGSLDGSSLEGSLSSLKDKGDRS